MGKKLSLISKGIAIVFAIIAFLFFEMDAGQIVTIALFIAVAFLPVDASMIINNAKGNK